MFLRVWRHEYEDGTNMKESHISNQTENKKPCYIKLSHVKWRVWNVAEDPCVFIWISLDWASILRDFHVLKEVFGVLFIIQV